MSTPRVEEFRTDHRGHLVNAPDLERRLDGRTFLAERFHVFAARSAGAWVWVEGRAVRADGSIGTANRGDGFDLDVRDRSSNRIAPEWLVDALRAAGVTW